MKFFSMFITFSGLLAIGIYLLRQDIRMLRLPRIRTVGKYEGDMGDLVPKGSKSSGRISFVDEDGKSHTFVDTFSRNNLRPASGSEVAVLYPVGKPEMAQVPRVLLRISIYVTIFGMAGLLLAAQFGLLGATS